MTGWHFANVNDRTVLYFDSTSKFCSYWQPVYIGPCDGLAPNRWQAITLMMMTEFSEAYTRQQLLMC